MRIAAVLSVALLTAALAGCSEDEPKVVDTSTRPLETGGPTRSSGPEMTTLAETDAATLGACVTLSDDGYSYSFDLDVREGEVKYRVRMPHHEEWDDWSSWKDENTMSFSSGFSFGNGPPAADAVVLSQVKARGGERTDHTVPFADLSPCPEA